MTDGSAGPRLANAMELMSCIWEHAIVSYRDGEHLWPIPSEQGKVFWTDKRHEEARWDPPANKHAWLLECLLLCRLWREEIDTLRWRHVEVELCRSSSNGRVMSQLAASRSLCRLAQTLVIPSEINSFNIVPLEGATPANLFNVSSAELGMLQDRLRCLSTQCINLKRLIFQPEYSRSRVISHICLRWTSAWAGVPPFQSVVTLCLGWSDQYTLIAILRRMPSLRTLLLAGVTAPYSTAFDWPSAERWPSLHVMDCESASGFDDRADGEDIWCGETWLHYGELLQRLLDRTGKDLRSLRLGNIRSEILLQVLGGRSLPKLEELSLAICATSQSSHLWSEVLVVNPSAFIHLMPAVKRRLTLAIEAGHEHYCQLVDWMKDLVKPGRAPQVLDLLLLGEWEDCPEDTRLADDVDWIIEVDAGLRSLVAQGSTVYFGGERFMGEDAP